MVHAPIRALIIEDDQVVQDAIAECLRHHSIEVHTASQPRELYDLLGEADDNNTPYDVFLADYWLRLNHICVPGSETYHEIRLQCGKLVPIIAASSDMIMWENIRNKYRDTNLHLSNKVNSSGTNYWDEALTLEILTQLKFIQPAITA